MEGPLNHHRAGTGEPLVLIHGIGSSWRAWLPVLPALEAGRDVVALDLPGFGDSPGLLRGVAPDVPALTDAVERHLDAAGLERPHLAGNSLGGWISLELARRGRARGVVALSPAGMWTSREAEYARGCLTLAYAGARGLGAHAGWLTRTPARRLALLSLVSSRPWRINAEEARLALEALAGAGAFLETLRLSTAARVEGLDEVRVPVTVAWGSRDLLLLPRQGARFVRALPSAVLEPLPGAGHVPMWDHPDRVARTILAASAPGR